VSIAYLVVFGSVLTFFIAIYALQNLPAEIVVFMRILIHYCGFTWCRNLCGLLNAAIAIGAALLYLDCTWSIIRCETLRSKVKHQLFSTHLLNFRRDFFPPTISSYCTLQSHPEVLGLLVQDFHQGYKDRIGFLYHNSCAHLHLERSNRETNPEIR
jgi:hypothetical protein